LSRCSHCPQRRRGVADRDEADVGPGRAAGRGERRGQLQPGQEQPQLADQVESPLGKPLFDQHRDDGQRRFLGDGDPVATGADGGNQVTPAVLGEVPAVQLLPFGVTGGIDRQPVQHCALMVIRWHLGEVTAGGETAVQDLQSDPGRRIDHRGA
jgi:hypothetical protein